MISSLINMKTASLKQEVDLSDLKNQIDAIRIVYEKLNVSEQIARIDFKEYVQDLLSTIFSSYSGKSVLTETTIPSITLPTGIVVPLGLIINEIATNAVKHGFTFEQERRFSLRMEEDTSNAGYILTLSNNGRPFPDRVDVDNPKTLGLQLIRALVDQLNGTLELKRKPHPKYTIRFSQ
jgi:two-component sensor histidine kinase